jgi:hypothetical protein
LLNMGERAKKGSAICKCIVFIIHSFFHKRLWLKTKWKYYTCQSHWKIWFFYKKMRILQCYLHLHFIYIYNAFTTYKCVIINFKNMIHIYTILCESKSTIYMHNICCNLTYSWDKWTNNFKSLRAII